MTNTADDVQPVDDESARLEERVLVLHKYGRNASVICRLLTRNGLICEELDSVSALADAVAAGAGLAIIGDEMLSEDFRPMREVLKAQPAWSEIPVVLLVPVGRLAGGIDTLGDILGQETSATVLEVPARGFELISFARAALRTRRRQYELRDHFERERSLRGEIEERRRELEQLNETLEQRVEERSSQVQELSRALTRAEQQERQRIAHILHDDLQQRLYAIQMKMDFARKDAHEGREGDFDRDMDTAVDWLQETVVITRNLTTELKPPILDSEGLTGALEWIAVQMEELHGLQVSVEAPHAFRITDADMRVLLFQIVRELLFNVVKHAGTDAARIKLWDSDHRVRIDVEDEGRGFDVQQIDDHIGDAGFGLFSARERIRLFGGHVEIESRPGAGTRVRIELPIRPE